MDMKEKPSSSKAPHISMRHGLFVLMFIAVLMMGVRVQDMAQQIAKGEAPDAVPPSHAETAPEKAEEKHDEKKEDVKTEAAKGDEKPAADINKPEAEAVAEEPQDFSEADVNILKRLSERRQELEKRARELDQRETILKLTEQRVDARMTEMKGMQEELRRMVGQISAEQKARAESLVKIYETMKPKDAARIFEALDLPTLLGVVSRMKEARVAPILAAMDPQKAKNVTSALMDRRPLPNVPPAEEAPKEAPKPQ
jgi:flagellar motility protein MotE (MotC chaperone)